MRTTIIATLALLCIMLIMGYTTPPQAQPDTAALEQQIAELKVEIAETREQLEELEQSHSLYIGVSEDLSDRISKFEGSRRE
jgi:cell division protein FtsL